MTELEEALEIIGKFEGENHITVIVDAYHDALKEAKVQEELADAWRHQAAEMAGKTRKEKERADKAEAIIEQLKGNALNFNSGAKTKVVLTKGRRVYTDTTHDPFPRLDGAAPTWKGDEEDGKPQGGKV